MFCGRKNRSQANGQLSFIITNSLGERTLKISNSIMVSSRAMSIEPCAKKSVSSRRLSHSDRHDKHLASHTLRWYRETTYIMEDESGACAIRLAPSRPSAPGLEMEVISRRSPVFLRPRLSQLRIEAPRCRPDLGLGDSGCEPVLAEAAAGNPSGCDAMIADPGGEALLDLTSSEEVEGEAEGDVDDDCAWRDMRRLSFVVFSSEIRRLNSEITVWQPNSKL
jgi:hypothetical protein